MNRRQFIALFLVVALLFVFISGCAGVSRIDSFFQNQEFKQHAKLIDFGLFFVIFFALSFLGLSKVWGEGYGKPGSGKGAITGLSIALALALAFALITQTSFSITTIFPVAKAMFFLVITFVLYGVITKAGIFGDSWMGKVIAFIIALMFVYLLASIFTHFVCQMSDNMSDPACQSDFFNAATSFIGRIFGIDSWKWSGGGSYWGSGSSGTASTGGGGAGGGPGGGPGGTGTTTKGVKGPDPTPAKEMQGGCRMDILFAYDSTKPAGGPGIADYAKQVKASGKKYVYVYGFASDEGKKGKASYNYALSRKRGNAMKALFKGTGVSTAGTKPAGSVTLFGAPEQNRRVVLSTEPITKFLPAGSGSPQGCKEKKPDDKDKDEEAGGWFKWWYLLPLLLLLLLFLRKKKKEVNIKESLLMKGEFRRKLLALKSKKNIAWSGLTAASYTSSMGPEEVRDRAQEVVNMLDAELKAWKPLKKLLNIYAGKLHKLDRNAIEHYAEKFDIDKKHAHLIEKIVKKAHDKYPKKDKFSDGDVKEVVTEVIHGNKIFKHLHEFCDLEHELGKLTEKFMANEEKILVNLRRAEYKTLFGKRVGKGKEEIEENIETPAERYGILEVTQAVKNLCSELITKIDEVLEEWKNDTANHDDFSTIGVKWKEELQIIDKLLAAIEIQQNIMSETWRPFIDDIVLKEGKMQGHVHYKAYRKE
jgi:hypothetical protein